MKALVEALMLLPVAYLVFDTLYLVVVTAAAFAFKKATAPVMSSFRIVVVIPAHNEEDQIAATVSRILEASKYPQEAFGVLIIADNCEDRTAELARQAGANVFERTDLEHRGKGQALDWCFRTHRAVFEAYDAVAIVDADTSVDADFLAEMARTLACPDVVAVQGRHAVRNPGANWRTALIYAAFTLINHVRPAGRDRLGGSAGLNGNGMAFRTATLLQQGWPAHSIVEDVEFSLRLLLDGALVRYNPDALVSTDMPLTRAQAVSQRRRWELGRFQVARMYVPRLAGAFLRRPTWRYLDACLDLLVPPISILVLFEGCLIVLAVLTHSMWLPALAGCVLGLCVHVGLGLYLGNAPGRVWLCLFAVPLFLLWKIPLYVMMLVNPSQKTWVRTARQTEPNPKTHE